MSDIVALATAPKNARPEDECCLYHAIINALDRYAEAHSPQNINGAIDALITVAAELMAMYHDTKVRKLVIMRETDKLATRTSEFQRLAAIRAVPHPAIHRQSIDRSAASVASCVLPETTEDDLHAHDRNCADAAHRVGMRDNRIVCAARVVASISPDRIGGRRL
jgi:hypothetical protein